MIWLAEALRRSRDTDRPIPRSAWGLGGLSYDEFTAAEKRDPCALDLDDPEHAGRCVYCASPLPHGPKA